MSTLIVSARPCEYRGGFIVTSFDFGATQPGYRAAVEVKRIEQVAAAVTAARVALAGGNWSIYLRIVNGRKPNGFDAWKEANRALLQVKAIAAEPPGYAARVRELEAEGLTTSDAQGVADAEAMQCGR